MTDELMQIIGRKQVAIESAYAMIKSYRAIIERLISGELPLHRVQVKGDSVTVLPELEALSRDNADPKGKAAPQPGGSNHGSSQESIEEENPE